MSRVFGVMLVGCGYIGHDHLSAIYYQENIRLVSVVDTEIEKAKHTAKKYGALEYGTDYREFLERSDIDIVIIATYVDSHLSIMKDCVVAGKHVLCEKPVTASRAEGAEFFRIAQSAKPHVLVGHILRYNRSYQKVKELVEADTIGRLRFMRFIQNHHAVEWERYRRLLQDCPPVLDCGVHYLDVMQWISGQTITGVSGGHYKLDADAPQANYSLIQLQLSGGCCGSYESGWSRNLRAGNCRDFIGERGYIRLTLQADRVSDREEGDLIEVYHSDTGLHEMISLRCVYKDMNAQIQELIGRIEGKPQNSFTLEDAKSAFMAAMDAIEANTYTT